MSKLKRLANENDALVDVVVPYTQSEISDRKKHYPILSDKKFATRYRRALFQPVTITYKGERFDIQMNCCINSYCSNFGLHQKQYDVKGKPKRYKLSSSKNDSKLVCNPNPKISSTGVIWGCTNRVVSNWAIAEEIKRLTNVNAVQPIDPEYNFHKEECDTHNLTPFMDKTAFRKCGKSSSNSQKYQCKSCKKITNVLPTSRENTTYHQQRNDILPLFATLVTNKTPVKRVTEILGIGSQTYYTKLEWLYKRCLEFQERYESKLKEVEFNELWINTDKMVYFLNNIRKKNAGSKYLMEQEEKQFPTHVVISSDILSRYVFRSDVAYDWDITLEQIKEQTMEYKDDHLHTFAQRYGHLRLPYAPQPPTDSDSQTESGYRKEKEEFDRRAKYIDGLHINSTYTTIAHLWHLKHLLKADEWRFCSDQDSSIISAIMRVFSKEVKIGDAHHFTYKIDKSKTLRDASLDYNEARDVITDWAFHSNIEGMNLFQLARMMLAEELETHKFHTDVIKNGKSVRKPFSNPIRHPLPFRDSGYATVDCTTDVSSLEPIELARLIQKANNKSTDAFINQIRRRISILERPLVTSRGDGKSYIYANFNPKYAQYVITILRTYYNFCMPFKGNGKSATPAQRIGITKKVFDWKDIIYFR
ncbi:insertion element protein [Thalassobacillus hwangdonensis]|uniref:Insertion element protein n=1 Tax=Thalassobacillus hwangdonensis TaxID=546108 RepID=A0ABW3L4U2_9BACI